MDRSSLIDFTLFLADNALILGHRNSEWCGHGPVLEQDIAITNISLDLLGQARNFYQHAASLLNVSGNGATEDSLAYLRDAQDFKNCLLAEQPNGDWAHTILRQFFFSNYHLHLYSQLSHHEDEQIVAIAVKSLKEVSYHIRWSSEWVIRLGDGTDESAERMVAALDDLWPYTDELFQPAGFETGVGVDLLEIKSQWLAKTEEIFREAQLSIPIGTHMLGGGKMGNHSEYLQSLLADMQFMQRAYPGLEW